jgi:hypothetical protein
VLDGAIDEVDSEEELGDLPLDGGLPTDWSIPDYNLPDLPVQGQPPSQPLWQIFNNYATNQQDNEAAAAVNAPAPLPQTTQVEREEVDEGSGPTTSPTFNTIDLSMFEACLVEEVSMSPNPEQEQKEALTRGDVKRGVDHTEFPPDPVHMPSPIKKQATGGHMPTDPVHMPSPCKDGVESSNVFSQACKRVCQSPPEPVPDTMRGFGDGRQSRKRNRSPSPKPGTSGANQAHGRVGGGTQRRRFRSPSPAPREAEGRRAAPPNVQDQPDHLPRNAPRAPFIMQDMGYRVNMRYRVEERKIKVSLRPGYVGQKLVDLTRELYQLFDSLLKKVRDEYNPHDRVRFYIEADNFHKNLVIHLRDIQDMTPDVILNRLAKITQSDESIPLHDSFMVHVGVQARDELRGTHGRGDFFRDLDPESEFNCLFRRHCVVQMKNKDTLCVARSLVILDAKDKKDPNYRNLIHPANAESMGVKGLKKKALTLQHKAGLEADQAVTFADLSKFEEVLQAQVLVVDGRLGFSIVYPGHVEREKKYFLLKVPH